MAQKQEKKPKKGPGSSGRGSGDSWGQGWETREEEDPCARAFGLFRDAWIRGEAPDPEVFCAGHPECGPELLERIQDFLFVARRSTADAGGTQVAEGSKPLPPPPSVEPTLPETIGPYKVLRLLGEGGMGAVYLVEQTEPVRRRAALKLIRKGMDSRGILKRFEAERQALVMMSHPNIARVLDAGGSASGQPYFVMEYIDGPSISEYCRSRRLGIPERIRLFMKVLEGVRHAHQRGVIHRDLKPGNILVEEIDGEPVPKIIDFGLARAVGESLVEGSFHTLAGQVIGTPEYMSPEQAGYLDQDVDLRTDIYSLGIVLYELLTGAHPFGGPELRKASLLQIQKIIFESEPPKPSSLVARQWKDRLPLCGLDAISLSRRLKGDLDWILLKALEKDRERRYQTAGEFLEDLRRHLDHEPVLAGPPSIAYKTKKFLRKHGLALAAVTAVVLTIVGALFFSLQEARARSREARARVKEVQARVRQEREFSRRLKAVLARARATADSLLSMAVVKQKQGENSPELLWKEDFESYPFGPFDLSPSSKSRWRSGGGNDKIRISTPPWLAKGSGKWLELEGELDHPDGAVVSTLLDPENGSYLPDFWVEFKIVPYSGETERKNPMRGSLSLQSSPDWRGENVALFQVMGDWRVNFGTEKFLEKKFPRDPNFIHHVRIHYQRVSPDRVWLTYFIDAEKVRNRQNQARSWTVAREARTFENRLVWLSLSSGDGKTWFDDIQVYRTPRARPWRRCPFPPYHEYMLTPRPVTRSGAEAWARRWGGTLAAAGSEDIRNWFSRAFGQADLWVAGRGEGGLFPYLAGTCLFANKPEEVPDVRMKKGDSLLPALLEFSKHPPVASAIKTGPGCAGLRRRVPRLFAAAPPVAGRALDLILEGGLTGDRAFLLVGTEEGDFNLSALGFEGCRLRTRPEMILSMERCRWNPVSWNLFRPIPGNPALFGWTFYLQAVLESEGVGKGPIALSNGLRIRVGIEPPRGSLAWAVEAGMSSTPQKKPRIQDLAALPGGGVLLAGDFFGDLVFPGPMESWSYPGEWPTLEGRGDWDCFLAKADPYGRVRWAKTFGGEGLDQVGGLGLFPGGKTGLLVGVFHGAVPYGGGSRVESLRCAQGKTGIFAAFFGTGDGEVQKASEIGEGDFIEDVRLSLPAGAGERRFYVSGIFRGTLRLGEKKSEKSLHVAKGKTGLFLACFGLNGDLAWAVKAVESGGALLSGGVCATSEGAAAVAGSFKGDLEAGNGYGTKIRYKSSRFNGYDYWDMFVARFRRGGKMEWCRHVAGKTDNFARDLACASDGTLFLTGGIHHAVHFWEKSKDKLEIGAGGGINTFLACIKSDGRALWGVRGTAKGGTGQGRRIAVYEEGGRIRGIYLVGFFDYFTTFRDIPYRVNSPLPGNKRQPYSAPLVPTGKGDRKDAFVACFFPNGNTAWVTQAGGIGDDEGLCLCLGRDGSPLVGGTFMGPATFGLGEPNQTVLVQGTLFLAKFRK